MTATDEAIALAQTAAQAAADKLASDIVLIDVSDRLAITDVFVDRHRLERAPGRGHRRRGRGEAAQHRAQADPPRGPA